MLKLIKQSLGTDRIAVGISGTECEIQAKLDSLINWGVTDSARNLKNKYDGLHLGNPEHFQYITTTPEKLLNYFVSLASLKFDVDALDFRSSIGGRLNDYLQKQAQDCIDLIPDEVFLRWEPIKPKAEYLEIVRQSQARQNRVYRKLNQKRAEMALA